MTSKDRERLGHIIDEITLIRDMDGIRDIKTRKAIERSIEIIGEAANHVSGDLRKAYPSVPWAEIIAYRNRLIHGYFGTDEQVLWTIVDHHLDALEEQISAIVKDIQGDH